MRKALALARTALALTAGSGAAAIAQDNPLANRPQDPPAALRFLQSQGVKLTYLGEDGGVRGYLGESPDGKMQTFYMTPDGAHVVAGVLFRAGGMNVTGVQIGAMQKRFEDARKQLGGSLGGATPAPSLPSAGNPAPDLAPPSPGGHGSEGPAPENPAPEPSAPTAPKAEAAPEGAGDAAAATGPEAAAAYLSRLDKDDFVRKVGDVAWFSVGAPEAPAVYMVADPQCPFCHAAWSKLRPMVTGRKLAVNVILISGLKGSEPLSVSLLSRPEPGKAWFAGEGSERDVPVAPPPAADSQAYRDARTFLEINNRFAREVGLKGTPFFAYVGRDGKLYSAEGPRDLDAFLSAL